MANPYLRRPLFGEYKHVKLFGSFWIKEILDLASKWGPLLEPKLEPPTVRAHCAPSPFADRFWTRKRRLFWGRHLVTNAHNGEPGDQISAQVNSQML